MSCDAFWGLVLDEQKPVKKVSEPQQIQKKSVQSASTCLEAMEALPALRLSISEEHRLEIEIDSNQIIDDQSLQRWLLRFVQDVYANKNCPVRVLHFKSHLSASEYRQGVIWTRDAQDFIAEKISASEFIRRVGVQALASEALLQSEIKLALQNQKYRQVLRLLENKAEDENQNLDWTLAKANAMLGLGQLEDCLNITQSMLNDDPQNTQARFIFALALKAQGRFDEALQQFDELETVEGLSQNQQKLLLWHRVEGLLKNNQNEEALNIISQHSLNGPLVFLKAMALRRVGKIPEAIALYEQSLQQEDDVSLVLFNLVLLYLDERDAAKAQGYFQDLKYKNPKLAAELEALPALKITLLPENQNQESTEENL